MAIEYALKALVKNGKNAIKNGVKNGVNGVVNGATNGNGVKNGVNGFVTPQQAYIREQAAKRAARQTSQLPEEVFVEVPDYGRTNYIDREQNKRAPGGVLRADRPTKTKGPSSKITTASNKLYKLYPEAKSDLDNWIRGAYRYARDPNTGTKNSPLQGYPFWIAPDGQYYKPKPNQKFGQGYSLKIDNVANRKATIARRTAKERPWTNNESRVDIMEALMKVGKSHKFARLIQIMKADYRKMKAGLGGKSKGHIISLDDGGIDVAENIIPQELRNKRVKYWNSKAKKWAWKTIKGNASMGADSTGQLGTGITSWEQYIALKLAQL